MEPFHGLRKTDRAVTDRHRHSREENHLGIDGRYNWASQKQSKRKPKSPRWEM